MATNPNPLPGGDTQGLVTGQAPQNTSTSSAPQVVIPTAVGNTGGNNTLYNSSGGTTSTTTPVVTPSQPSVPLTPSQQAQAYQVQSGDTLSGIAQKYGTTIAALQAANPNITDPNKIFAGSSLKLPSTVNPARLKAQKRVDAQGSSPSPTNAADATTAFSQTAAETSPATDPTTSLIDPIVSDLSQGMSELTSYENTHESVASYTADVTNELGLPQLQTEAMNLNVLLNGGTEQNLRDEINASGGFATEGNIEALTYGVNKTLQIQAAQVQNQINGAQTTLSNNVTAYSADYSNTINAFQDRISNDSNYISMQQSLDNNARTNYQQMIANYGPQWMAQNLTPTQQRNAESLLGYAPGFLSNPAAVASSQTKWQQTLELNAARYSAQGAYYDSGTLLRELQGAADATSGYTSLPAYQAYQSAEPYINKLNIAQQNPGSVSDAELIQDFGFIVNAGAQVVSSEQQQSITGGQSLPQYLSSLQNKVTSQGGSLSQSQRDQIFNLSQKTYAALNAEYQPIYSAAQNSLNAQGLGTYSTILPTPQTVTAPGYSANTGTQTGTTNSVQQQALNAGLDYQGMINAGYTDDQIESAINGQQ